VPTTATETAAGTGGQQRRNRPKSGGKRLKSAGRTLTLLLPQREVETMTTKEPIDALVIRHLRGHQPIRIVCAWCRAVLVDVPEDERGTSHGMCDACYTSEVAGRLR
jgi:hypothetical protein